jgi:hypothetical protein
VTGSGCGLASEFGASLHEDPTPSFTPVEKSDFYTFSHRFANLQFFIFHISVPDLGSGDFLTPGSGICFFSGSRIQNPYFFLFCWVKST